MRHFNEVMTVTRYTCCTICLYHNTVNMVVADGLDTTGTATRSLYLRNSPEGGVPIDFIDRYPIFNWVSMTCLRWEGTETHVVAKVVTARARLNIKMILLAYGNFNYKDKTVVRPCHRYNGNSYTGKTTSLYWDDPQVAYHMACIVGFDHGLPCRVKNMARGTQ